ncbi:MAG: hypothetical protein WD278_03600 [Pirellulales bacterium]
MKIEPADAAPNRPTEAARPFQFGLRALFAGVAGLCALFALMDVVGFPWSVVLAWFALLGFAHVAANAWGTKAARRTPSDRPDQPGPGRGGPGSTATERALVQSVIQLRENKRPGRSMVAATVAAALVGGSLGTLLLVASALQRAGIAGVAIGGVSSAVVGGLFGFLASSFVEVAAGAWHEAAAADRPHKV